MTNSWQLQEAEDKLDRLIEDATDSSPQIITRHGVDVAVVLPQAAIANKCHHNDTKHWY